MAAIILAGGKSRRMAGYNKAFLKIDKEPIIKRQLKVIKKYFKKIIIVTNSVDKYRGLRGVKVISDITAHQGPLGGILSGLLVSPDKYNFVLACDIPFINLPLVKYMHEKRAGFDVVVPKINNRYEPLFGIYSKNCVRYIKLQLTKKDFKITRLFPKVKVRKIIRKEIIRFGNPQDFFMNINTPRDFLKLHHG